MKLPRRTFLHLAAGAAALPTFSRVAWAQAYPARPVRVTVPFAPGGPTDVCARLIAQKLSEQLGRQFYVENVAGAGGNIGTGQAARAAADGYSILIAVNSHVINPALYGKVPYDAFKDFEAVTLAAAFASALSVHPSVPANNVKELVTLIKASPGRYSFASPGFGTPSHLLGEQFRVVLDLDLVHVPYGGSGPAITSVVAGHTPIAFAALSAAARARGHEQEPLAGAPRPAHHRTSRLSRSGRRWLGRGSRSRRHAKRNNHVAPTRNRQNNCAAGDEGAPVDARL
jgi:tripartite-type tricarboxylate transporter receptor subunit TctC